MEEGFNLNWDEGPTVSHREEVISGVDGTPNSEYVGVCEEVVVQDVGSETIVTDQIIHDHGQAAQNIVYMPSGAGNIVYMTQNNVVVVQQEDQNVIPEQAYMECQVTEEVVTDDWVQPLGDERVEIIGGTEGEQNEDDVEIPLSTDQDENITSRPHPCDFCSRRFRKKANLINHLVAHQTDRPHGCNLCGSRYIRKCDLMNHLKIHAYVPDTDDFDDDDMNFPLEPEPEPEKPYKKKSTSKKHKGAKIKIKDEIEEEKYSSVSRSYDYVDEDMRLLSEMAHQSATRVGYETIDYSDMIPPENHPVSEPRYPITDPRKPFVCQHCGVGFAREKALASHARIHGGDSPFECETCGDMFWDLALLREHVRNKHSDLAGNMSYDDDDDEDYVEDDDKYGDFYCETCGMIFHRQYLLRRHSKIHIKEEYVNESEFGHVCNVCGDTFQEALDLLAHAEVHARLDVHRCMQCGESFSEEQLLASHVSQRHSKTMAPNSCMLCGKTCKDRRTLLKHSWEHSREKTFACSKCGKSFHNKARLKRHMVSHRNKAVTCNVCGEDFPDGRSLMNHRHSHNNLAGRQFPCRECGKTFGSRSSQQIHIRIHTGERPYACRFCWKAFADGGTLRKHERIHTGEKPYACAVCPRAFNQRVVLREHIRSHHSGPDPKYGTSMTPYCCAVCSDLFSTSQDLILHLIQHCDMNTAMKRQPQVGPRKYKRRRKLKPHELERISNRLDVDDEPASESDDNSKRKLGKKNKKVKSVVDDNFESVMQGFENTMKSINTIVNSQKSTRGRKKKQPLPASDQNSMSSRPKMIHTQKTKVAVEVSDGSKVRHKTKTLITRTTPAVMSTNNLHPEPMKVVNNNERERNTERNRPRTKNVSYHVLQPEKYQVATFGSADNVEQDCIDLFGGQSDRNITIKNEPINIKKENSVDFNEDLYSGVANNIVVNDCPSVHFDVAQNIEIGETVPEAENEVCIGEDDQVEEDKNVNFKAEVSRTSQRVRPVALNIVKVVKKPNRPYNSRQILGPGNKIIHILKAPEIDTPNESIVPESLIQTHQQQSVKMEPIDATSLHELAELSMQHAQNKFKCEMCSETFSDRGQLLLHVKIHI